MVALLSSEVKAGIPLDARDVGTEKVEYPAPAILADGDLGQKTLAAQDRTNQIEYFWMSSWSKVTV